MRLRYRLQRKEHIVRPYILGDCTFLDDTYRWRDIAGSDDLAALEAICPDSKDYRIEDTRAALEEAMMND